MLEYYSLRASPPLQKPTLTSEIIHCTAPSPTVNPDEPLLEQRHSNVGVEEQMLVGKFESRKEMKHSWAQLGTNFVISGERLVEAALASAITVYAGRIRLDQHRAILTGTAR